MSRLPGETTRRGVLAALLGGGTTAAAASPANWLFERLAPLSGEAWDSGRDVPETVESPYGAATVSYDDTGVPHVEADGERAAYFALGYAQAADRLWQLDFLRRLASGSLAEVVGARMLPSDERYAKLDLVGAAEASREAIAGTDAEPVVEAFAEGVDAYATENDPGRLFGLLDYEPEPWTVRDTALISVFAGWSLSQNFRALYEERKRAALDDETYRQLYPRQYGHDAPVIRGDHLDDATVSGTGDTTDARSAAVDAVDRPGVDAASEPGVHPQVARAGAATDRSRGPLDPEYVDWLSGFDPETPGGSNAWTISGEHTASGRPLVASDPHLDLQAPPFWYEQRVSAGDVDVRGIATPGTPFPLVGENDHGAWGMTSAAADQTSLFAYETDGDRYRYRGEWREFDVEERTVAVRGGDDRTVEVRKTVHGPYLERGSGDDARRVAVGWTGFAGDRTMAAGYRLTRSTGLDSFRDALREFAVPALNFHYADVDGRTLFQTAGRFPIRRVDGEVVPGGRVFDGSAGHGEWAGFDPYGQPSGEGFVPFDDLPSVIDAGYVASANQRIADDLAYPLGGDVAEGYRAARLYDRLDATVGAGETVDRDFVESLQLDAFDPLARDLVPELLDVRDRLPDAADPWLDALADWDYQMTRDSAAALAFDRFYRAFRQETVDSFLEERGLPTSAFYRPADRVLAALPPDSPVFDGDRTSAVVEAMRTAVDDLEESDAEVWGDHNETSFDHLLGGLVSGLNYPRYPTDGGPRSVRVVDVRNDFGASYRTVVEVGGESRAILPGGNDGAAGADHYDDQLERWADGEYRTVGDPSGDPDVEFTGGDR